MNLGAALVAALSSLVLLSAALSPVLWIADTALVIVGAAWIGLGGVLALVLGLVGLAGARSRRRTRLAAAVLALVSSVLVAAIAWPGRSLMPIAREAGGPAVVKVLQVNLAARSNDRIDDALLALASSGADVVVVTEFPHRIWGLLRGESDLSRAFPHFTQREWVPAGEGVRGVPGCVVMSRWPIEALSPPPGPEHEQVFLGRVDAPAGSLMVGQITPSSPRSPGRWRVGNADTRAAARVLGQLAESGVGPVALACDLNSTALGKRGRLLRRAGLAPGKPAWSAEGTWPEWLPMGQGLVLDDVWVGGGARVLGWRTLALPGSDHRGAMVSVFLGGAQSGQAGDQTDR